MIIKKSLKIIYNHLPLFMRDYIDRKRGLYYSCIPIRQGFNFYRSNKVISCCYGSEDFLIIGDISDSQIINKIEKHQNKLIKLHKTGKAPAHCKSCPVFSKGKWTDKMFEKWTWISLNHYKACNLKCVHCNYRKTDDKEQDSNHELVRIIIESLYESKKLSEDCVIGIGGGEPSINKGMDRIFQYFIDKNLKSQINSNGAAFSEVIAYGINKDLFELILTPDAGSKEVYEKIKGVDFFEETWNNIKAYMEATNGKAKVKFIIEEGNINDIGNMISMCKKAGVKHCELSFDLNIKKTDFEKYREPVNKFINLCKENNIECILSYYIPKSIINRDV